MATPPVDSIAAADWSLHPAHRALARASRQSSRFLLHNPTPIPDSSSLLRLSGLLALDFPIGLPAPYCSRAAIPSFLHALHLPFQPSNSPSIQQPFYPASPGGRSMLTLESALHLPRHLWLRRCDQLASAAPLFWTLGPKQAGKAALSGWRELLAPRLPHTAIWPFHGPLHNLLHTHQLTLCEIYPALAARLLQLPPNLGKRHPENRRLCAPTLLATIDRHNLLPDNALLHSIRDGFPSEHTFDAFLALLATLTQPHHEPPPDPAILQFEGWILLLSTI